MPRLLESGGIGIRLAIDQVGGNGVDDLQQTAILAVLEANGKSRIRIIPLLSEIVGDRKIVQVEKKREILPLCIGNTGVRCSSTALDQMNALTKQHRRVGPQVRCAQ